MTELDLFTNTLVVVSNDMYVIDATIIICRILQSIRKLLVTLQNELTVNLSLLSYFMSTRYMSIDEATEINKVWA